MVSLDTYYSYIIIIILYSPLLVSDKHLFMHYILCIIGGGTMILVAKTVADVTEKRKFQSLEPKMDVYFMGIVLWRGKLHNSLVEYTCSEPLGSSCLYPYIHRRATPQR